jgi:hypothetical protein
LRSPLNSVSLDGTLKRALAVAVSIVALLLAGLQAWFWFETPTSVFPSFEAARAAGALERGLVPAFVPASASQIKVAHALDSGRIWLTFVAPEPDLRLMASSLTASGWSGVSTDTMRAPWWFRPWPRSLQPPLLITPPASLGYFTVPRSSLCAIVAWGEGRVYVWGRGGAV